MITEKFLAVDISADKGRIVPSCISRAVSGNITFYRHWNESNFFFQITFFFKDLKITLLILQKFLIKHNLLLRSFYIYNS